MKLLSVMENIPGIGTPDQFKKKMEDWAKLDKEMTAEFGKDWNEFVKNKKDGDKIKEKYFLLKKKYPGK